MNGVGLRPRNLNNGIFELCVSGSDHSAVIPKWEN